MAAYDVGIVGYGPVGAVLANLLSAQGLSVAVFEREAQTYHLPRAVHCDGEVMRVFQSIGLADAIEPTLRVNVGMRFVDAEGRLLMDWPRPPDPRPQGWQASHRFHQPDLENALRRGLARFEGAQVFHSTVVQRCDPAQGGVLVGFQSPSGERGEALCRYVVGCDGARSTVRRIIGSPMEDLASHERWLVVDVLMSRPAPELLDATVQYCDPARPVTVARGTGVRRRWEFMLLEGEDAEAFLASDTVWRLLSRWITPDDGEIERAAVYTFHAVLARQWRADRLLLAGDAAHQTPPFLGQGLCAGVRDASNLAWKLTAVIRDGAPETLLDTYQSERLPHARAYIEKAVEIGALIQATDPEQVRRRDAEMRGHPVVMRSIAPPLGPGLHGDAAEPAGTLSPQPRLPDGRLMDDAVGARFALLARGAWLEGPAGSAAAGIDPARLVVLPDVGLDFLDHLGTEAVLIRPDRYILGAAKTADELRWILALMPPYQGRAAPP